MSCSLGRGTRRGIKAICGWRPSGRLRYAHAALDLLEYQGKELFAKHGVPVPEGRFADSVDAAVTAAEQIGFPCVIKAQVQIGGRGKAGGIKLANDSDEAAKHADAILGMDITGPHGEGPFTVHEVWVEAASEIEAEYYFSFILDRSEKKILAILSTMGGMDVEAIAEEDPEALVKRHVNPGAGFEVEDGKSLAARAGVPDALQAKTAELLVKLYAAFTEDDATL